MNVCTQYNNIHENDKQQIVLLIKKMCGKGNIADITIEKSQLKSYDFVVTVWKYSNSGNKGWATIGYLRNDLFNGGVWRLTYKPKLLKGEINIAGKTASYQ